MGQVGGASGSIEGGPDSCGERVVASGRDSCGERVVASGSTEGGPDSCGECWRWVWP